ncbi:MAG: hypothetical protein II551_02350, partial [Paludibacteraceae bacterium]|nr:hypothetical protein [Paludibacteraceae bacterium]
MHISEKAVPLRSIKMCITIKIYSHSTKHTVLADRSSALHEKRKLIKEKKQKKINKEKSQPACQYY